MKKLVRQVVAALLVAVLGVVSAGMLAGCKKEELTGFDIELARAVAQELGVEVKFQEIEWAQKDNELNAKNIDLIWNGFTITDKRKETTTFSMPYLVNKQSVVVRKADASKYTTLESLASANLTAEAGSAGESVIAENETLKTAEYVSVPGMINILTELKSGTSDAGVMDSIMADYYLKVDSSYADSLMVVPGITLAEEEYGIGMRFGSLATADKINTALSTLQANGKLEQLAKDFGLEKNLLDCLYTSQYDSIADKSDWEYITGKNTLIVGYTLFAPIAYFKGK